MTWLGLELGVLLGKVDVDVADAVLLELAEVGETEHSVELIFKRHDQGSGVDLVAAM